jgi:putative transcriptional regulator
MLEQSQTIQTFTNYLLIGINSEEGNIFHQAVVYICEHSDDGALGLVLNKEIDLKMSDLFKKLGLEISPKCLPNVGKKHLTLGGPSEAERGFVLHLPTKEHYSSSINRMLSITTSLDILENISKGKGPKQFLMALGCSNWSAGQLEQEMKDNLWLALPASMEVIFDVPSKDKYNTALSMLGIKPWQLSMFSGNG